MELKLTWHGHATWLIESQQHRILIDPFLDENPSATAKAADISADFVLITHGHFDHVADAASITNRCAATLVANFEIATWFEKHHQVKNTIGMNLGGSVQLPFGSVKMTLAHHSSQLPDGSYGGNPGGFLIKIDGITIYFAGDTALFSDMQLVSDANLDVAVLPIGDLFTMGPEDSLRAIQLLTPRKAVPAHFNTWPPIEQNATAWADLVRTKTDAEPLLPEVGKAITI